MTQDQILWILIICAVVAIFCNPEKNEKKPEDKDKKDN